MESATFGKYLLCERLAEGGMAVVWRAKLIGPGGFEKEFCLKQIRQELAARSEFVDLFVAEAKLTVSLTHANIVPVYELGMVDGTYFLALELIDGPTLAQVVKKGPLEPALAAYVAEQVLRGLDYAHRRGVIHRDLSAANVLLSRDGEVKIVDFGIASTGGRAVQGGSRGYMAPEQEKGAKPDARSDLYAVGVLVYELATGRRWDGSPLETNNGLAEIVARATEEQPDRRYPDAGNMLSQVSRFLRELSLGPTQLELSEYVRRHFPPVAAPREARDDDAPAERTGPQTAAVPRPTGPQTALAPGRTGKQVTFATRIALPGTGSPRRGLALGALALLVAAASGGFFWWRSVSTATPGEPTPPVNAVAPAPNPPTPPSPNPATRTGRLSLTTTPPGAEARLGDRPLGQTPLEADVPLDGPQALHLRKRGHQPLDISLPPELFTGTPPRAALSEKLIPLGRGELTLNALPWAHVTIDGEKRPDTPLLKYPLPAGPHQVRVACPATGRELKFTVVIEADKEARRLVDLRAEPKLLD